MSLLSLCFKPLSSGPHALWSTLSSNVINNTPTNMLLQNAAPWTVIVSCRSRNHGKFLLLPRSSERVILPSSSWIWQFRANLGNCGIGLKPCQWPSLNGALLDLGACSQSRPHMTFRLHIAVAGAAPLYCWLQDYFNTICIKSSRIHHNSTIWSIWIPSRVHSRY
jgi:hypothetical protein